MRPHQVVDAHELVVDADLILQTSIDWHQEINATILDAVPRVEEHREIGALA